MYRKLYDTPPNRRLYINIARLAVTTYHPRQVVLVRFYWLPIKEIVQNYYFYTVD